MKQHLLKNKTHKEQRNNNILPFLGFLISRANGTKLETHIYHKTIHTKQVLHYQGDNLISHKRSCIKTPFRRVHTTTLSIKKSKQTIYTTSSNRMDTRAI